MPTPSTVASMPTVSVVIPNYNGLTLLPACLATVKVALLDAALSYEIIISDDASTDASIDYLTTHHPEVIVLKGDVNRGFSKTINKGIAQASGRLLFLLNNDVTLSPCYFKHIITPFDDPMLFGIAGQIRNVANTLTQDAAKYPSYSIISIKGSINYLPTNELSRSYPTFFLSGANALVCRNKMSNLGGFCELFSPFYYEDTHIGILAWRAGYHCLYHHDAISYHPNSITIKKHNKPAAVAHIVQRNKLLLHYFHLSDVGFVLFVLKQLFIVIVQLLFLKKEKYKAFESFVRLHKKAEKQKQRYLIKHSTNHIAAAILKKIKDVEILKF